MCCRLQLILQCDRAEFAPRAFTKAEESNSPKFAKDLFKHYHFSKGIQILCFNVLFNISSYALRCCSYTPFQMFAYFLSKAIIKKLHQCLIQSLLCNQEHPLCMRHPVCIWKGSAVRKKGCLTKVIALQISTCMAENVKFVQQRC